MGLLDRLFGAADNKVSHEHGKPFPWPKGLRLQAVAETMVVLPGAIMREGEQVQSVIEAPDDAKIGFDPSPDGKGFETIRIVLKSGDALLLHRSSQAMIASPDQTPRSFVILAQPEKS